jgi:hypothetical protein
MTTAAMTDKELLDYSGHHLLHELSMLWELAEKLPKMKASIETSAFVVSFWIHLRNLIDFFFRPGHDDDVTALDFMEPPTAWGPTQPAVLARARERANKDIESSYSSAN